MVQPEKPVQPKPLLSFYEIMVVDEMEKPIVGADVRMITPAGGSVQQTDAGGRVRVDQAPPGLGSAQIVSARQLAECMRGHEHTARREDPLPRDEPWTIQIPSRLARTVTLPDGLPQKLMIVSRVDVYTSKNPNRWSDAQLADAAKGPWTLKSTKHELWLELHSDGLRRTAILTGPTLVPETPGGVSLPPEEWLRLDVDALHEALFDGDFATAARMLVPLEGDPPGPPDPPPPPLAPAQIAFDEASADVERSGAFDDPNDPGGIVA